MTFVALIVFILALGLARPSKKQPRSLEQWLYDTSDTFRDTWDDTYGGRPR
jgi:hypothetical protein